MEPSSNDAEIEPGLPMADVIRARQMVRVALQSLVDRMGGAAALLVRPSVVLRISTYAEFTRMYDSAPYPQYDYSDVWGAAHNLCCDAHDRAAREIAADLSVNDVIARRVLRFAIDGDEHFTLSDASLSALLF